MNKIAYEKLDQDGVVRQGRLTFGNIVLETPAGMPTLRTVREPDDLEFLSNEKDHFELDHIQGCIVRLYDAPTLLETRIKKQEQLQTTPTIDMKPRPVDPFTKFRMNNLILCDPAMEYTRITREKFDKKFMNNLWFVDRLVRYFKEFEQRRAEVEESKAMSIETLRESMHSNLWFGSGKSDRKERNSMAEQIMRYQLKYYSIPTPVCPMVKNIDELKVAIELNEVCQGLAYANDRDCISYIPFHRSAIKDGEVIAKWFEYVRSNKTTKLDGLKFKDLDLHCPVDFKARNGFKHFMEDVARLKQDQPDKATMMFDAGTQSYVAMQICDIVSTSLTGSDIDVGGGDRDEDEPVYLRWWDERKMWPRPTDNDAPLPNPQHCPYCSMTPNYNMEFKLLNRRRRGHRLFDFNRDATDLCRAVTPKKVGVTMRRRVQNAEFSYANDLILSP